MIALLGKIAWISWDIGVTLFSGAISITALDSIRESNTFKDITEVFKRKSEEEINETEDEAEQ